MTFIEAAFVVVRIAHATRAHSRSNIRRTRSIEIRCVPRHGGNRKAVDDPSHAKLRFRVAEITCTAICVCGTTRSPGDGRDMKALIASHVGDNELNRVGSRLKRTARWNCETGEGLEVISIRRRLVRNPRFLTIDIDCARVIAAPHAADRHCGGWYTRRKYERRCVPEGATISTRPVDGATDPLRGRWVRSPFGFYIDQIGNGHCIWTSTCGVVA
jgi:hypothetical protein